MRLPPPHPLRSQVLADDLRERKDEPAIDSLGIRVVVGAAPLLVAPHSCGHASLTKLVGFQFEFHLCLHRYLRLS